MTMSRSYCRHWTLSIMPCAADAAEFGGRATRINLGKATLGRKSVETLPVRYRGSNAILLRATPDVADDATFAAIRGVTARDFVIEAVMSGAPVDDTTTARGFVGIAFRIFKEHDRFEAIYLARPTPMPTISFVGTIRFSISRIPCIRGSASEGTCRGSMKPMRMWILQSGSR